MPVVKVSTNPPTGSDSVYIKRVKQRENPMATIKLDGYATCVVMQALQEADLQWDRRIADAESGFHAPNFSIEGAKLCRDDLRAVIAQLKDQI